MKILLAIPSARYIETECITSIFSMKKKGRMELFIPCSYSVDVARNNIAKYAKDNKFDYIFWVDSDIILPKDTLVKLLSHGKDIVAGVYAYKIIGGKNVVAKRKKEGDTSDDPKYEDIPVSDILKHKGLMKVDGFGFGCVLTKTEIFDKIPYPWFIYTQEMGEDIYLCRKAQNAGYELFLDTSVLCGHKGEVNFNIRGG